MPNRSSPKSTVSYDLIVCFLFMVFIYLCACLKVPLSNSSRCGGALRSYSDISSRDIEWEELNNIGKNKIYGCSLPCDSSLHHHRLNEPTVIVPVIVQGTLAMLVCLFTTVSCRTNSTIL